MPESLSVLRKIICFCKEILFLPRRLASHLKMHNSNTQTADSADSSGCFLDTRSEKVSEKRICNPFHSPDNKSSKRSYQMQLHEKSGTLLWLGGRKGERKIFGHGIFGQAEQNVSGVTPQTTREPFMAAISLLCGACRNMPRLLCDSARLTWCL